MTVRWRWSGVWGGARLALIMFSLLRLEALGSVLGNSVDKTEWTREMPPRVGGRREFLDIVRERSADGTVSVSSGRRADSVCVDVRPLSFDALDAALNWSREGGMVVITHANGGYSDMVNNMVSTSSRRVVVFALDASLMAACPSSARCVAVEVLHSNCGASDMASWADGDDFLRGVNGVTFAEAYQERLGPSESQYFELSFVKIALVGRVMQRGADRVLYVDPDIAWARRDCAEELFETEALVHCQEKHSTMMMSYRRRIGTGVLAVRNHEATRWLFRPVGSKLADHRMTDEEALETRIGDAERLGGRPVHWVIPQGSPMGDVSEFDTQWTTARYFAGAWPPGLSAVSDLWESAHNLSLLPSRSASLVLGTHISPAKAPSWLTLAASAITALPSLPRREIPCPAGTPPCFRDPHLPTCAKTSEPCALARNLHDHFRHIYSPIAPPPQTTNLSRPNFGPSAAALIASNLISIHQGTQKLHDSTANFVRFRNLPSTYLGNEGFQRMQQDICLVHYNFLPPGKAYKIAAMILDNAWNQ